MGTAVIDLAALGYQVAAPEAVAPPLPHRLGRLGELAGWLAAAQGHWPPTAPATPRLLLVGPPGTEAGLPEAGLPEAGLPEAGLPQGGLPEGGLAGTGLPGAGLPVRVVVPVGDVEPALAAGIAAADAAADEGVDLLVAVGLGADVPAAAALAALTDLEPTAAVATDVDDAAWRREVVGVRDLLRLVRPHADTPYALLSTVDSAVLSALAGLVLRAAVRRTPVVLDGLAACAAAATVFRLAPFVEEWWLVADRTGSPAQHAALDLMRLRPVFDLGTAAGQAGPLVLPVLRAAARLSTADAPGAGSGA